MKNKYGLTKTKVAIIIVQAWIISCLTLFPIAGICWAISLKYDFHGFFRFC